jgi:radical SAM superfamily enzyme YgiQ (UPF0313 family)
VATVAAAGLQPRVDFIFGLPGETDGDRARTRDLIRHLVAEYGVRIDTHVFTPLPGTPFAGAEPTVVDEQTRELVESLVGQGRANGFRCFARLRELSSTPRREQDDHVHDHDHER